MPANINPYMQGVMTDAEYRRNLIATAQRLNQGQIITSREAALFTGQSVACFLMGLTERRIQTKQMLDRKVFDKNDIGYILCRVKRAGYAKNVYTGKRMDNKATRKAMEVGIEALSR